MDGLDTLKTATIGITGSSLSWLEWLPPFVSIVGGVLTALYMSVKLYKELYGKKH